MALLKKNELRPTTIKVYKQELRNLVRELRALEAGTLLKSKEYYGWLQKRVAQLERQTGVKASEVLLRESR